jgi:predicted metalloprotease with PDZ domain
MAKSHAKKQSRRAVAGVRYRITPGDPKGHFYDVICDVAAPAVDGQRYSLPAWIPGSYMIREFARNVVSISAECHGKPVELVKHDKHSWQAAPCDGALRLRYRVYAWDASVRAAVLDESHGFFNGTSVFLCVAGHEHEPHEVEVLPPAGRAYRDWQVATTLPELAAKRHGFGSYRADDYDALIDHPVEMGSFRLERFKAAGVPHEIAYTGVVPNLDAERINADVAKICAAQIRFFAEPSEAARGKGAPFDRYVFLTTVSGEGYGGLEHRSSTALLCSRESLPIAGDSNRSAERSAGYLTFLGLVSHEYFHSWNVKRIKPAVFAPYDLTRENYTSLLWIFEGFTSYYDDLFLVRTKLATDKQYLAMIANTIADVTGGAGRKTQSIAESSFDAWVKYYRQDENTPNAVVSYYKKGSLVALCLDLFIRSESRGKGSLDDVMKLMWQRYGRGFYPEQQAGIGEDQFPDLVLEATGIDVRDQVRRWAYGTQDLPLDKLLEPFGLRLHTESQGATSSLDARLVASGADTRLASVTMGGASHRAGLSAGDVLIALDGLRIMPGRCHAAVSRYQPGETIEVTAFRGDVMITKMLKLAELPRSTSLVEIDKPSKRALALRSAWLAS